MLLNVSPNELVALRAAMDLALKAASGYSVRTCPSRDVVSEHWKEFTRLNGRINALEAQREFHMSRGHAKNRKYIHTSLPDALHARLHQHVLHLGGGKVQQGALTDVVEAAIRDYLDRHPVVLAQGQRDADAA